VLAFPDVLHLFAYELACLRAGALALTLVLPGSLQRSLLRHDLLLDGSSD
jgi:hypothetical protein